MSTAPPQGDAQGQPAPITIAQTLLVLSAVGSAVGLIVSIYLVGLVMEIAARFATLSSFGGAGVAEQPAFGADSSSQVTVAAVLAVVETVAVIAVSTWAFRAIGRRQAIARTVLAVLAGAQLVLSVASTAVAGAGPGLVVVAALVALLVFDAPVLLLLFGPAESRRWFEVPAPAVPAAAVDRTPRPGAYQAPPGSWGPPTPTGPPPSAPFPAGSYPPSGPLRGPGYDGPGHDGPARCQPQDGPGGGGRHAAPRPAQY